jgi:formate dehydrogenase major subunit
MVLEMLLADCRSRATSGAATTPGNPIGELSAWATRARASRRARPCTALRREQPAADLSHPAMAVNLDACIQCNRCVRACREVQVNDVIG